MMRHECDSTYQQTIKEWKGIKERLAHEAGVGPLPSCGTSLLIQALPRSAAGYQKPDPPFRFPKPIWRMKS